MTGLRLTTTRTWRTRTGDTWPGPGCLRGVESAARFHALVAPFAEDPAEVAVAIKTDRGLFVGSLVAVGYTVLAVNPMSIPLPGAALDSGAKSGPGDALVLAELERRPISKAGARWHPSVGSARSGTIVPTEIRTLITGGP